MGNRAVFSLFLILILMLFSDSTLTKEADKLKKAESADAS
ncbi:MAG: hypothetical protein PWQ97_133 [Tepidanaerobacteraceae bacterium]|nr:hypothetical protein [Tepidanaerobacteraceae bacterium]